MKGSDYAIAAKRVATGTFFLQPIGLRHNETFESSNSQMQ